MNRRLLCKRGLVQLVASSVVVFAVVDVIYLTLSAVDFNYTRHNQHDVTAPGLVAAVHPIAADNEDILNLKVSLSIRGLMTLLDSQLKLKSSNAQTSDVFAKTATPKLSDTSLCVNRPNLTLLIYVHTSPRYVFRRTTLRDSWANHKLFKDGLTQVIFVMGTASGRIQAVVESEFRMYRDILQGDFTDHYYNQSLKAEMALSWIHENCPHVPFILKASDDAYVNIFDMIGLLKTLDQHNPVIACPLNRERLIMRNPTKCPQNYFCTNYTSFPGRTFFPPHCDSTAYLMSSTTVALIVKQMRRSPYFWLEEVYVTSMLVSHILGMKYADVKKRFASEGSEALRGYIPFEHQHYLIARSAYTPDIELMWSLTLSLLTDKDLLLVNDNVIRNNPVLRRKQELARNASTF